MDAAGVIISQYVSVYSVVLACLCFLLFISSRIPKGFFRLISLLPVFFLFAILPLQIPSSVFTVISSLFLTSLANFYRPLFASGQAPVSPIQSSKKQSFYKDKTEPRKESQILSYTGLEFLLSAILIGVVSYHKDEFHPKFLLVLYCCLVLLAVDCLGTISNWMLRFTVGMEPEPPSDKPYLSSSLQDFWGKRWNIRVTNCLRATVYEPVRSKSTDLLGYRLAQLAAVLVTFLVSGLMHELFFYYLAPAKPTWEMTLFFVLHGFCVAFEVAIKKAVKGKWNLPRWVSGPLTIGFMMVTSFWLFFPPLIRSGADAIVLQEFRAFAEFVQNELLILLGGGSHGHRPGFKNWIPV